MTAFGQSNFGIAKFLDKRASEADAQLKRLYDAIENGSYGQFAPHQQGEPVRNAK